MSDPSVTPQELIALAERVARMLRERQVESLLIGAMAMAAHGYVRATEDVDLGIAVEPTPLLPQLARDLQAAGYDATYLHPEPDDPLGGVVRIDVSENAMLDVVNFENPWHGGARQIIQDALAHAPGPQEGLALRVAPLEHLIALKLYAGGPKSASDVSELLRIHPELDRERLRAFLARFNLAARLP